MNRLLKYMLPLILAGVLICIGATVAFASETNNLKVNFVDSENRIIKTAELAPGEILNTSGVNASVFSASDGKVRVVDGWYIKGSDVSAAGFSYTDIDSLGVREITVYPQMSEETIINTFAIYTKDELGISRLHGNPSDYANMSSLGAKIAAAPDGAFVTLLYDKDTPYDMGGRASFSIGAEKTLNFDLNGRMLVQSYGSTSGYGGYIFVLNEKSTLNVYSTANGGAFYQARFNTTNQNNYVFAPGLIGVTGGVDTADINVGDIYDKNGNLVIDCVDDFSLYGGTLVFVPGSTKVGDGKVNINVNGGFYYHSMRSGYALFTIQAPDVYINMNDAKVYNSHTTYSVVHDYDNGYSESHFVAKNSEFICRNNGNTANTKFYFGMCEGSTAYFEDCVIMASVPKNNAGVPTIKGTVTFGAGNIIAGDIIDGAVVEEGVLFGKQNETVLERYVTHPPLYSYLTSDPAPIIEDENGKWGINPIVFDKSAWVVDALKSCEVVCGTYKPDGQKSSVKEVRWFDRNGNQVGDSEYWVVGSKLVHKEFEIISGNWYDIECSWCYEDGTLAPDVTLTKEGESWFYAKPQIPIGRINDKLANVTLSEKITFNLYLPISSGVTVDSISANNGEIKTDKIKMDGRDMYQISWEMPYGSFEVNTVTLKYRVEGFGEFDDLSLSKNLECEIELDLLRYASIVAESSLCNSDESILIYEIIGYVKALAAFTPDFDAESIPNLKEFFLLYDNADKHVESACECKATVAEDIIGRADSAVKYDSLTKKGVESIDYVLSSGEVGIRVFVKKASVKIDSVTCTDSFGNLLSLPFEFVESGNYYLISGVSAMYIDNVITINIGEVSGTYSLARFIFDYISEHLNDYEESDIYKSATALFKYARLADMYNMK